MAVLKKDEETTTEDIQQFLHQFVENGIINKWAIPSRIDFVEVIPKTSAGKIDKKRIRAEYRE